MQRIVEMMTILKADMRYASWSEKKSFKFVHLHQITTRIKLMTILQVRYTVVGTNLQLFIDCRLLFCFLHCTAEVDLFTVLIITAFHTNLWENTWWDALRPCPIWQSKQEVTAHKAFAIMITFLFLSLVWLDLMTFTCCCEIPNSQSFDCSSSETWYWLSKVGQSCSISNKFGSIGKWRTMDCASESHHLEWLAHDLNRRLSDVAYDQFPFMTHRFDRFKIFHKSHLTSRKSNENAAFEKCSTRYFLLSNWAVW